MGFLLTGPPFLVGEGVHAEMNECREFLFLPGDLTWMGSDLGCL